MSTSIMGNSPDLRKLEERGEPSATRLVTLLRMDWMKTLTEILETSLMLLRSGTPLVTRLPREWANWA